jgi:hypothetical protein
VALLVYAWAVAVRDVAVPPYAVGGSGAPCEREGKWPGASDPEEVLSHWFPEEDIRTDRETFGRRTRWSAGMRRGCDQT